MHNTNHTRKLSTCQKQVLNFCLYFFYSSHATHKTPQKLFFRAFFFAHTKTLRENFSRGISHIFVIVM